MINKTGFRALLESHDGNAQSFGRRITHLLGLTDESGRYHMGPHGQRVLKDPAGQPRIRPDEVSVRGLMEALCGDDGNATIQRLRAYGMMRPLLEADESWGRSLLEDNGAGAIMASSFANINAFTAAATGLLEVMILEAYQNPDYIGDKLAPVEPSKIFDGRKTIGASRLGDVAEERLPGMPTRRAQVGERWITQPRTVENSLSCEITQEALFLDLTGGQLADHAGAAGVGDWLAYRKELRIIDSFIGVTSYTYNYKGTTYAVYIAAGYYDNYISSGNELLHEDNVQASLIKFRDMTDPETGTRVMINPNAVLINREKTRTANAIFGPNALEYQLRDAPGATTGTQQINVSTPYYKGKFMQLESPLVFDRMTAASGLGLSTSAAGKAWFMFESGTRTHVYVQNWPLRTQSAAPNQVDMIDRGVVMYTKADERGIPMWKDPRRSVFSKA